MRRSPGFPALAEIGITAVELMPVAQFPGDRNWGYDGVYPFAVQNTYGGPSRSATVLSTPPIAEGLAVFLDVVYNHFGPEGNYLRHFGPYFTDHYKTPWGEAVNFDGPSSDPVRRFIVDAARLWIRDFHIDGLRLDARPTPFSISEPGTFSPTSAKRSTASRMPNSVTFTSSPKRHKTTYV